VANKINGKAEMERSIAVVGKAGIQQDGRFVACSQHATYSMAFGRETQGNLSIVL
jgi:hypothetical protein